MATRFGARQSVVDASLSPDGRMLAFVQPMAGQGAAVYITDLSKEGTVGATPVLVAEGKPDRIESCKWASNSRLLCNVYGISQLDNTEIVYVTRIVAVDADGKNLIMLRNKRGSGTALGYSLFGGEVIDWTAAEDGHVLMMREYVPETTTGTRLGQTDEGIGVDDVDTRTLRTIQREQPKRDASDYISDGTGTVRILAMRPRTVDGYSKNVTHYSFRKKGSRNWEPLSVVDDGGNGFIPYAVDSTLDVAYGFKRVDGRLAAFSMKLDGSGTQTLLFAHPQVDIDGFVRIGRNRRVIGVSYATDRREVFYIDEKLAKLAAALSKALPKLPLVRFIDSSQDESRLLLWVGSDVDPGRYYLFDKAGNRLEELISDRPQLAGVALSTVRAVSYPATDGTMIPGYLTLPPQIADAAAAKRLPAIVLPHGGPGARDEWGFDWLSQFYANQGYVVLQPNFRGSSGYGDQWFQKNGFQNWRTAVADIDAGGRWLVAQGIADPARLAIVGWSYGGHAALQSAVVDPGLFKAVVAIAPVTDLDRLKEQWRNWSNYQNVSAFVGNGQHIEEGSPARHAKAFAVPVMMFHGTVDRNVAVGHARLMDARLKKEGASSTLVIYDGLDHYLDDSNARVDMLKKSHAFLKTALGQ
ncbi:alpha/beta hydrolase family protein [Sphingobium algorifonticola]|nr:S9 family peptidase [Sphingobium algorifonticola]